MTKYWIALAIIFAAIARPALAQDCDGVVRQRVAPADWPVLLPYIQKFFFQKTAIRSLQSMQQGDWLIIQAGLAEGGDDPPFVFFRGYPSKPRVVWEFEGIDPDLMGLAIANAPGIPHALARCFAWSAGHAKLAFGADDVGVCAINQLRNGDALACGPLKFKFHSESQCLPLKTPELDGTEDSKRSCASVQRACLTIEGDAAPGTKAFNRLCADDLASAASKAAAADSTAMDNLDTDHEQELESVIVRPDLISVRWLEGSCVLQAAGCSRRERNFHWLRRVGRPLVAEDFFGKARENWAPALKALFETEIQIGQGKQHIRPFPDGSCSVENSDSPDRWRFEKDGIAIRIMGMFDCSSNTGGGIVVLGWDRLKALLRPDPPIGLTGPAARPCKKNDDCMD
jgi:hypothetical protein